MVCGQLRKMFNLPHGGNESGFSCASIFVTVWHINILNGIQIIKLSLLLSIKLQ